MSKIISLVQSAGMAPDAFREYWREKFLASLLEIPAARENLVRVVHNHVVPSNLRPEGDLPPGEWAGAAVFWFYDRESGQRFLSSPDVARAIASHADVMPEVVHLHVRELGGWDLGGEPAVKIMSFFLPRGDTTREVALQYWNTHHLRETRRLGLSQRLARYLQNHTFSDHLTTNPSYNFAGGLEMWLATRKDADELFADEALLAELQVDEAKFVDQQNSIMFLVEEENVYPTV